MISCERDVRSTRVLGRNSDSQEGAVEKAWGDRVHSVGKWIRIASILVLGKYVRSDSK